MSVEVPTNPFAPVSRAVAEPTAAPYEQARCMSSPVVWRASMARNSASGSARAIAKAL